jgi:hypothetical protein
MTRSFLACAAIFCLACGGDVDLGGANELSTGGGTSTGGSSGTAGATGATGGGAGLTAGAGGTGAGGAGGTTPVACSTFQRTNNTLQVSNNNKSSRPSLVETGSGATIVYRRFGLSSWQPELTYPSWSDPWNGAWTKPTPSSTSIGDLIPSYEHRPAVARGTLPGSVVVLHGSSDNACMTLTRAIPDHAALAGFPCPPPFFTFGPDPAAVTAGPVTPTGGERYIAAFATGFGGVVPTNYQMNFSTVDLATGLPPGTVGSPLDALGCATAPVYARGWYSASAGYLAVFTTSRPFLHCQDNQFADGPPTRVQIVSFGPSGELSKTPELVHELVLSSPVLSLELAVRSDGGAWIALQTQLAPSMPGAIQTVALDSNGKPSTNVKSVVAQAGGLSSSEPASYAVTTLGNRLVLGGSWMSPECATTSSGCQGLRLHIVDETSPGGAAPNYISEPSSVFNGSPVSLLASPDGSRLIAAYSDFTGNPTDVWAERYECLP